MGTMSLSRNRSITMNSTSVSLHASHAERIGLELADLRLPTNGQAEPKNAAAVARVDEAVVPQAGGGEQRRALLLDAAGDACLHRLEPPGIDGLAIAPELLLGDDGEHAGGLLRPHHGDAVVGP